MSPHHLHTLEGLSRVYKMENLKKKGPQFKDQPSRYHLPWGRARPANLALPLPLSLSPKGYFLGRRSGPRPKELTMPICHLATGLLKGLDASGDMGSGLKKEEMTLITTTISITVCTTIYGYSMPRTWLGTLPASFLIFTAILQSITLYL